MRKAFSILLALCLGFAGVIPAVALTDEEIAVLTAQQLAEDIAAVEEYNKSHGGEGKLVADIGHDEAGFEVVFITGEVSEAKKGIALSYCPIWKAKLSGDSVSGEALVKGDVILSDGAEIRTSGRAIEGDYVRVDSGIIFAAEAIHCTGGSGNLSINGGSITGDISAIHIEIFGISGGTINGSINVQTTPNGRIIIYGGVVNSPLIKTSTLVIEGSAHVSVDRLEVDSISVAKTATTNIKGLWWRTLPSWVQWILRYLLFGWIWMD